jgi:hypothetical protein
MLRALVLLLLVVNAALYAWLGADPHALQADREPQRLQRQVAPDAIQVLPDVRRPGARTAAAASSTLPIAGVASTAAGPSSAAPRRL